MINHRTFASLIVSSSVVAFLLLASSVFGQTKTPIKIGLLAPLSGPTAESGKEIREGFLLAFEEVGNKVAGREIQIKVEDDEFKPDVGLTKARRLVESDKVHMLAGVMNSAEAYAIRDYVHEKQIPWMITLAGGVHLTAKRASPYIFRSSFSSNQPQEPYGEWVAKNLKYRKAVMIANDFTGGYEWVGAFSQGFLFGGGEILQELYPRVGTTDFAPYLTTINPKADVVYAGFTGIDAVRFVTQYKEYGLKDKIPLIGTAPVVEMPVIRQVGDAALGVVASPPSGNPQAPEYVKFRGALAKKGVEATTSSECSYEGGLFIIKALQAVNGNIEDKEAFLKALRAVKLSNTPGGTLSFDKYQNVVRDINVVEVKKVGGELALVGIGTIPQTNQFWKFSPEEYMAKAPDYPTMKGKWAGRTKPMW